MKYPVGLITAVILSMPLSIIMLFSIPNLILAFFIVIFLIVSFAISGLLYDLLLMKVKSKLITSLKFVFFSGTFWFFLLPILRYCNEYLISIFLNQSIIVFSLSFIITQSIFGFGFGLFYSIVYARISAFLILRKGKNQRKLI